MEGMNDFFKAGKAESYSAIYQVNTPIPHIVIDGFLREDFALKLYDHFPSPEQMKVHYHGLNEKKSEHSDFSSLDSAFTELHAFLSSEPFRTWLSSLTTVPDLQTVNDRLGYGLHQGANNSFLDIHIDYNIHPVKKIYRKLNLILFLNKDWESAWGGNLELWDEKVETCVQSISPVFNRCVIFECSEKSYHGYSRITVPEKITRKSFYQYFFIEIPSHTEFHDTIFHPTPDQSLLKKGLTPIKEFLKNSVKKVLYRLRILKPLK